MNKLDMELAFNKLKSIFENGDIKKIFYVIDIDGEYLMFNSMQGFSLIACRPATDEEIVEAIKLSKDTLGIIKQNLVWAFAYNIIGIPVAAGLLHPFFGILLSPIIAGAAMAFSSVSVVSNS